MTENILAPSNDDQIVIDENKNYLEELVGDGKKFKSPEELAKGKFYADQTVDVLTKRLDELRADYLREKEQNTTRAKLEEIVDKLTKREQLASNEITAVKQVEDKPAFKAEDIEAIVANLETKKQAEANFKTFRAKLAERFGTNENALNQQIEDLGLNKEDVIALARKSPKAALKTLGLDQMQQQDTYQPPVRNQQRSDSFAPKGAPKRTWSYYQELKKKDPQIYFDRKIGAQMAQDAVDLGDAFYDGDFYVSGLHEQNR